MKGFRDEEMRDGFCAGVTRLSIRNGLERADTAELPAQDRARLAPMCTHPESGTNLS